MEHDHFSNLSFPQPKEAPYEICAKLAQWLLRSILKMLTDRRKVITIAHPEQSSGELKRDGDIVNASIHPSVHASVC